MEKMPITVKNRKGYSMKKYIASVSAIMIFFVCLMFGVTAYAASDISVADVQVESTSVQYTGSEIKPNVTVTLNGSKENTVLTENIDYTVSYVNNVNVGKASVVVKGINGYSSEKTVDFQITPVSVTDVQIKNTKRATPGSAPQYSLTYNGIKMVNGTDYTISTSNYSKCGIHTATVTIVGKGNFEGTKIMYASVYPQKGSSLAVTDRTTSKVSLKWASQKKYGVSGYKLYTCDKNGKNIKYYKNCTENSGSFTKREAGEYIYFVFRAYYTDGNTTIYGDYSNVYLTCTTPAKVTINNIKKYSNNSKLKVYWNSVPATGYEIQYSTDVNFKKNVKTYKFVGGTQKSKSFDIPKSDKVYYARIRAYRRYNNGKQTLRGSWSVILSSSFSKLYASYTTNYVSNYNRTNNLKISSSAINGTVIYPGQTFSFNEVVGKRTPEKGYLPATMFTGSTGTAQSYGGGICQTASTVFNAALLANFGIVERHQHSQRVTYVPLGRDSAIYGTSEDLKFTNTTKYPMKVVMKVSNGKMTCSFYTCRNISHKKVNLKVTQNGDKFTLKRTVDGSVNYTTVSKY